MADQDGGAANTVFAGAEPEIPPTFESILPDYPVRLTNFEGPLDLLIHLIKKNEVDVYDIPIVLISQQYLEYLDLMREIDLDVAGEFLVMAATLIHIKSRMLVPRVEAGVEGDEPEEDPRDALVQRLLEHQRFKAAAEMLHECETVRSAQWTRPDGRVEEIAGAPFERELEVDLFSLLQAFQAVLARARNRQAGIRLPAELVSIEARMQEMLERLADRSPCGFEALFEGTTSRQDLITTFLATLELIRLR
ncbi:MAG: segregation/condensation protein A, partial [Acidobacteria bacterium]|nr:segregation/condensation protein A [Acidobacteriota bacterium]